VAGADAEHEGDPEEEHGVVGFGTGLLHRAGEAAPAAVVVVVVVEDEETDSGERGGGLPLLFRLSLMKPDERLVVN
jgi:hypothetical protein